MAKITSGYTGGLNQDLAISKNDNKHIYNALDIDLITDLGESTAIISNHRGNSLQFRVPDVYRMFSITIDYTPPIVNTNLTILTSGGPVVVPINLSALADSIDVYNQIIADPSIAAAIAAGEFGVYYNSQEVIIQSYSVLADPSVPPGGSLIVTTTVPNQRDLSIIGWCTLEEEIVLFTTSKYNTSADPVNTGTTAGQVWVLEYDDALDTVTNLLPANTLNPAVHLKYNNIINFSLHNEIYREAIGRTESSLKGSVYWTDDYNRPRALNVYNPQCPAIPVGLLDWKPSVDMSTPIISAVLDGGLLLVGSYQVAYQLYSKDGAASVYSPASTLVPITDSVLSGQPYEYDGAPIGTPSGKSIRTTINHIDLRYDFIKVVLIQYESEDLAVINYIYDVPIDGESMSFTISGGENKVAITTEEFVNPLIFFDRCKTFTQKKNRLYPANTRTKKFDLNFDSRAYRFDNTQVCRLYSRDGSFTNYNPADLLPAGALYTLPDSADAVNPYNDESGQIYGLLIGQNYDDWLNNYQYKYKADGVTLGGQGPNVEYQFVYKQYRADDKYLSATSPGYPITFNALLTTTSSGIKAYNLINAPFIEPLNTNNASVVENFGDPLTPLDGFDHPLTGWDSLKNPLYSTLFAGYARGEIYRFGIVFYNDKGEESFVKWISDIRIPEPWEGLTDLGNPNSAADLSFYDDTPPDAVNMEVRSMGVQFKINNLPADITGFRVVRVERQQQDKTRHGVGMTLGIMNGRIDLAASGIVQNKMLASFSNYNYNYFSATDAPLLFVNNDFSLGSDNATGTAPSLHGPFNNVARITRVNDLGIVKSPDIDFGNYTPSDATYMKMLHSYQWPEYFYTGVSNPPPFGDGVEFLNGGVAYWAFHTNNPLSFSANSKVSAAYFIKARDVVDRGRNIITFNNQTLVDVEGVVTNSFAPAKMGAEDYHHISTFTMPDVFGDPIPSNDINGTWTLSGFGTKSLFCDFDGIPYNVDTPSGGSYINNPNSGPKDTKFRIVSLCNTNFGQYGGPWRSSRYNNTYISASDFIPNTALISGLPQYIKVFGGDTYVSFYSTTLIFFHWKEAYAFDYANPSGLGASYDPVSYNMSALAVAFPTEASLNLEYRDGKYWNKDQVFTSDTAEFSSIIGANNNNYPQGADFAKFLADEYTYNTAYSQQNNLKTYVPLPFNFNVDEDQPAWVWVSQPKFDREAIDSWRRYLVNDYLPLEAIYGPINKIINLKEMLLTYQTRGIAQVSSQESTALPDSGTGAVFQVGTGNVLARYDYLSKDFGAFHQHSVVTGPAAAYSFDIRNKKVFRVAQGLENMSDVKGLAAFFRNNLYGAILNTDTVLLNTGVHGVYDTKYNKVYFTFENKVWLSSVSPTPIVSGNTVTYVAGNWNLTLTESSTDAVDINSIFKDLPIVVQMKIGDYLYDVSLNVVSNALILTFIGRTTVPSPILKKMELLISFTIAFNEMLQAFESFYSFKPTLYLPTGKRLLSANPYNINNSVYQHNDGNFGQFYDRTPSVSEVEFIVNFPDATKVPTLRIDTLEFWTEVFDANGIDVPLETISGILLYNDYQSTGSSLTLLTPQVNVVRRERTWRINQLRDDVATYGVKSFLRDKYVKIKIFYNNQNNRYFRLNEFNTNVTLSYY